MLKYLIHYLINYVMYMVRKTTFSLVIDVELLEKLEEISRKTGESISSLIRKAVESWLELEEKK